MTITPMAKAAFKAYTEGIASPRSRFSDLSIETQEDFQRVADAVVAAYETGRTPRLEKALAKALRSAALAGSFVVDCDCPACVEWKPLLDLLRSTNSGRRAWEASGR